MTNCVFLNLLYNAVSFREKRYTTGTNRTHGADDSNGRQDITWKKLNTIDRISIAQTFSSRYHLQSNGGIENFHSTFKHMLAKVTEEVPNDWDRYLPAILFTYRLISQKSCGFSSNELIFGCNLRETLSLLKDILVRPDIRHENTYLEDTKRRIMTRC